ncbi:MAG TPA: APC family permease [Dokdonella sp.]|uniref:APC family permease n=1 Tax=Dokdonella sp. TaxID=2291710 RepID=UPI002D80FA03|nr:APC family permease [Dokdonella sp.]HET9032026.1 APC family permease [Dokdonella sp.]
MSNQAAKPIETNSRRPVLRKVLGRFGFFALAFGSMIGVGWVTSIGSWLSLAGPGGAVLAFLIGGAVMLCIGLCYAELTPMLPVAGGEVAYAYKAFGTFKAFLVGWVLAFGYVSISGFEAISIGRVLSYLLPSIDQWPLYTLAGSTVYASHILLGVACTAAITWVNWIGARSAARLQVWLTVAFVAVTAVFIVAGFSAGDRAHLSPLFAGASQGGALAGLLAVLVTIPFWFVGFDTIPQGAEEASASVKPRLLALLIVGSILAAIAFYVLIILSVAVLGPWQTLVTADLPAAHAFELAFQSPWLRDLVLIAALLGLFTSWNGFFLAGSRVVFALGRARIIPLVFGQTHERHGTPHRAVLLVGGLTVLAPMLGRDALLALVNAGSFCIALAFFGVSLSLLRLRRDYPDHPRPFRLKAARLVAGIAALGSLSMLVAMIVPGSPAALSWPREFIVLAIMFGAGGLLWLTASASRNAISAQQRAKLILD